MKQPENKWEKIERFSRKWLAENGDRKSLEEQNK